MGDVEGGKRNNKLVIVDGENCYNREMYNQLIELQGVDVTVVLNKEQNIKKGIDEGINIMRAKNGYKNAIDFVIIALATDCLAAKKYKAVEIVSDDKGYNSAVNYLKDSGYNIELTRHCKDTFSRYIENKQEGTFRTLCGFLANNVSSGNTETKVKSMVKNKVNIKFEDYSEYLLKMGYITKKKRRIYFDDLELSYIAKNKLEIGERLI